MLNIKGGCMVEKGATENQTNMSGGPGSPAPEKARRRIEAGLPARMVSEHGIIVVTPPSAPKSQTGLLWREAAFTGQEAWHRFESTAGDRIPGPTTPNTRLIAGAAAVGTLGALAAGAAITARRSHA